jgi:hypothetical protein
MDCIENTASNNSSIVVCISVAAGTFTKPLPSNGSLLQSHYSGFHVPCHNMI